MHYPARTSRKLTSCCLCFATSLVVHLLNQAIVQVERCLPLVPLSSGQRGYRTNLMRIVKRMVFGATIGALPGGLMVASTLLIRGEIQLTLAANGMVFAVFGAIVGLVIAATSRTRRSLFNRPQIPCLWSSTAQGPSQGGFVAASYERLENRVCSFNYFYS